MDDILMQAMTEGTEQSTDEVLMSAINEADEYDDILMHYGVDGMHWYERRYQNPDGSLTPLGRIHYGIGKARAKRAEKKIRKAEKAEADRVKKVERLARSGDVDKIYKNRELFTRTELEDAIERAEKIKALKASKNKTAKEQNQKQKVTPEKAKEAKITIDKLVNTAKTAVGAYAAYNALASAVNMSTGEHTLPQLDIESLRAWKMRKGTPLEDPAGKFYTNVSREDYEKGNANFTRTKLGKGDEKKKGDDGSSSDDGGSGGNQQKQQKQKPQKQSSSQNALPQTPVVADNKDTRVSNFGSMGVVYGPGWKTNLTRQSLLGTRVSDFDNHWTGTSTAYDRDTMDSVTSIANALSPKSSTVFNPSTEQLRKAFETTTMDEVEKLFTVKSYDLRGTKGYRATSNTTGKYRIYHRGA